MPYINQGYRSTIDKDIDILVEAIKSISDDSNVAGILNYVTTRICTSAIGDAPSYAKINEMIGMLECCKLELYRRVAAGYEDEKIVSNGDAYPEKLVS